MGNALYFSPQIQMCDGTEHRYCYIFITIYKNVAQKSAVNT